MEPGLAQFRFDLVRVLESRAVVWTVIALIILDMALVVTEVLLNDRRFCNAEGHLEFPNENFEVVEEVFHYASLAILSLFIIELFFLIFGLGAEFWRRALYVIDFVVVLAAFFIELFLRDVLATFVVLFRMVRLMHGIYISIGENKARTIDKLKESRRELKHRVRVLEEEKGRMAIKLAQAQAHAQA